MSTSIFHQGWKTGVQLRLNVDHCRVWGEYVSALQRAHIRLSDADDLFIWDKTPSGKYSAKSDTFLLVWSRLTEISNGGGEVYGNLIARQKISYLVGLSWKIRF